LVLLFFIALDRIRGARVLIATRRKLRC